MFAALNIAEGLLWWGAAALLAARPGSRPRLARAAAAVLVVFGISDFIEARTGAWWEPRGLLVLKAACVAALAALGLAAMRGGKRAALVVLLVGAYAPAQAASPPAGAAETVVLLHGMGRSRASMWLLGKRLRKAGYKTANFPYTQAFQSFDENVARLRTFIKEEAAGGRYHLVGHSLGNIVARAAFRAPMPEGLGRVVMLAPPNKPAVYAKRMKPWRLYKWLFGDSGQKLGDPEFYRDLPAPTVPFAVIAGTKGLPELKAPNDGIVKVENTRLAGMAAFREVHAGHTFIMNKQETFRLVDAFLRTGAFPDEE